jgi:site-specific recombinase XerC
MATRCWKGHKTTRQLNHLFHLAAEAAEIRKGVTLHSLRHSFATHLLESKLDIRMIQALLGHKRLDTTAHYTRVATDLISKVVSPGAKIGITSVLHTWGSAMTQDPHSRYRALSSP